MSDSKSTHRYTQFYELFSIYTMFIIHRGFGFVTFEDPISIEKVLSEPSHELDGKRVIMINENSSTLIVHLNV